MKSVFILLLCLVCVSMAHAQNTGRSNYTPVPPSLKTTSQDMPVVMWDKFCRQLVNHQPVSNVDIKPGQQCDVHGNPVVAADLPNQTATFMPREYRMFITSQQAKQMNIKVPASPVPIGGNLLIGEVIVGADGKVSYNGQPVETQKLYSVCEKLANQ